MLTMMIFLSFLGVSPAWAVIPKKLSKNISMSFGLRYYV
jgi:hypothetical protein